MTDTDNLLESVIQITKERDKRSLEYSLVSILTEYLDFEAAFLLNIAFLNQGSQLEIASYSCSTQTDSNTYHQPRLMMPMDDGIRQCIQTGKTVCEQLEQSSRTLFPIMVNQRVSSVLLIYSKNKNLASNRLIRGFIRIYTNFVGILDDGERDTLTGLLNRKAFDNQLSELLQESRETEMQMVPAMERRQQDIEKDSLWLGILDIDFFKQVNDNYGHLYGDEVLMLFANLMKESFRASDLLFRYGGEEFIVILSPTTESHAQMVFDRFRQKLEQHEFPQIKNVTASIGMAALAEHMHPFMVVEHADKALYFAKENGRNQVAVYQQLVDAGKIEAREASSDIEMF